MALMAPLAMESRRPLAGVQKGADLSRVNRNGIDVKDLVYERPAPKK